MFRTTEEEVKELVKELRELRGVLREISGKVAQIEIRAKRAFPAAFPKTQPGSKSPAPKLTDPPKISPQEALSFYDDLVELAKQSQKEEAQRRLENMGLPDLFLLSRELGVSLGKSKPSRKTLLNGVLGRLNESVMLSTSSLRKRPEPSEGGGDKAGAVGQSDEPASSERSESPTKHNAG